MNQPLLAPLHASAGAVFAGGPPPVLLTFGDVPDEYAAAQEGCILLDQTSRGAVQVRGPDAASFLHRLLANQVRELEPGRGNRNLLLSSKGKVLFDFDLSVRDEDIELSTPHGTGAALAEALEVYHFAERVEIRDASQEHAPLALAGPAAGRVAREVLGVEAPGQDHARVRGSLAGDPVDLVALPVAGSPGLRLEAPLAAVERLWRALAAAGARPAGQVVYDILRVEAGVAEPGVDVDENVYPQEARLESAFSLDKGCYVGQEVVAKIDTYGGLNKRLVGLRISHDDPVSRGTPLSIEEDGERRDLGLVTSWAYSFALDTGMALAYVKRRHQQPGTTFRLGDGPAKATVVELPVRRGTVATV